ncbi:OB-fold domain-containing protein [Rhizobium cauense]|uniref:Zn-ribbon domain-containing OB-fold protein n=1 Tax=Rhizobium cauense TaxID=1166683 RepID=UPI001C6ECDE2|nr:OB-fold domain-containing protein [Rhizobium cauense]MBW9116441.1 OB-fold domain-containing protein [Rhizobium cauense]
MENRPRTTRDTETYWAAARDGRLVFQKCRCCEAPVFHPRPACPYCLSDDLEWTQSQGNGSIYSFTTQYIPLRQTDTPFNPIVLGIVSLDEGFHMFTEIKPPALDSVVEIGQRVRVWFDDLGNGVTLPKFKVLS